MRRARATGLSQHLLGFFRGHRFDHRALLVVEASERLFLATPAMLRPLKRLCSRTFVSKGDSNIRAS